MSRVLMLASYADSLIVFRGTLLQEMVSQGHEVFAAAPDNHNHVEGKLSEWGVRFYPVDLQRTGTGILADLSYLRQTYRLIRAIQPDVVIPYTIKPNIYGSIAASLAGVPLTGAMVTGLGHAFAGKTVRRQLLNHLVRQLYRFGLRNNHCVFFQNPDDMALFRQLKIVRDKNHPTLINGSGVDLQEFSPRPYPDAPSFLLIARLIGEKGIREYASAARILKRRYPHARFRLVGWIDQNPEAIRKEELASWEREGTIEFLGRLGDIRPAMADASVFVLPSYYREGTPRTILEGLAMARPIVTCDSPGCRETVQHGENGFLVPPRDVSALAGAMEAFLLHPELISTMGRKSRRIAEEKYDVHLVNKTIMDSLGLSSNPLGVPAAVNA